MMSKSEEKKSTELESIIDSQFTDLDKMLSLCFQVEYKQSKGKEMISMIKSSIYVIDFIESSKNFSENFLTSIKSYIAQEIKDVVKPKHSVDEIVERMKINILNAPELIIIQSTRPTKFDNRFKYIPFSFTVQDLLGDEADSLVGKDEYEISNIVSYSVGGPKFEILTKHSNGKWSGYADGTELTPTHVEFANILFSIEGNDPPWNSWWLVSRPVLLIFKKKHCQKVLIANQPCIMKMKFTKFILIMKMRNKQFEADQEIAKKLQQELDDSEADIIKTQPPQSEPEPLLDDEWIWGECTLKNRLPDYRWDAWNAFDNKAYDLYYSRKSKKAKNYGEGEKWTCRYCDLSNDYRDYWVHWGRKKYKCDSKEPHCKYCNDKSENDVWYDCEEKLEKKKSSVRKLIILFWIVSLIYTLIKI